MSGVVTNGWPYVIAAFSVAWVVILGYTIRLYRMHRRLNDMRLHMQSQFRDPS